ncbi:hypothetical protein [Paenibacillus agilis]|uniref:Uncharacterized protein n=1 Tax=Paenibacillus agilis TaxID=3020863 RepID=A0A559IZM4_9BACL|nr:hypothetical protein [Paenibacillus agilis]TVX93063.1 hypothetical protein FPZ44_08310 [Paenibacillus agilis]
MRIDVLQTSCQLCWQPFHDIVLIDTKKCPHCLASTENCQFERIAATYSLDINHITGDLTLTKL